MLLTIRKVEFNINMCWLTMFIPAVCVENRFDSLTLTLTLTLLNLHFAACTIKRKKGK